MALPKHLRPRWRYLAVAIETWPDAGVDRRSFQAAVWSAGRNLLGDPGSADADLTVMRFAFDPEAGVGQCLVRARRDEVDPARAAISCVDAVEGEPVGLHVLGVSGTVRTCAEKYLRESPEAAGVDVVFREESRRAVVCEDAVDLCDGDTFTGATILDVE